MHKFFRSLEFILNKLLLPKGLEQESTDSLESDLTARPRMNNSTSIEYIAVITISSIDNIALICIIYIIDIIDIIAYI
jgi:hypothetical protein